MHSHLAPWKFLGKAAAGFLATLVLAVPPGTAPAAEANLPGRLLVAVPEMTDSNFSRTVIYLVKHDANGALGLVVNEPMGEVPLDRLLDEDGAAGGDAEAGAPRPGVLVHYGGPVEQRRAFILHSTDVMPESSTQVDGKIAFSRDKELLRRIPAGTGPRHLLLTLGYAGWAPGQLDFEIKRGSWYVIDWDESLVFGTDHGSKWQRAIALYAPEL